MKKFISLVLVILFTCETGFAFPVDTKGWICTPGHVDVSASEIDLKSDLRNEFRIFQATLTNLTTNTVDISIPSNEQANASIAKLLNSGLSLKDLMAVPKQIAVESYQEDVGTGRVAKAHKGLIYILASAGALAAGAGLLGIYPQQKTEEFISHKRIKKEYKKINGSLVGELTLSPMGQTDVLILVPVENSACVINTKTRDDDSDIYSDYHQL